MMRYYIDLKTKEIDNAPRNGRVEFYGDIEGLIKHDCTEYTKEILDIYRQEEPVEQLIEKPKQEPTKEDLERIKRFELENERLQILAWFKEHDWIINKVFLGEWQQDDLRYTDYLKERALKRLRYDDILEYLE